MKGAVIMERTWIYFKDEANQDVIYTVVDEILAEEKEKEPGFEYELKIWEEDKVEKADFFITDIVDSSVYKSFPEHNLLLIVNTASGEEIQWNGNYLKKASIKELSNWFKIRNTSLKSKEKNSSPGVEYDSRDEKDDNIPKDEENEKDKPQAEEVRSQREDKIENECVDKSNYIVASRSTIAKRYTFIQNGLNQNKTIGVWSPLQRMGVTTFVFNFAIYLASQQISTVVLEGISARHYLKTLLSRMKSQPKDWKSYAHTLHNKNVAIDQFLWNYRGVMWLPLDEDDTEDIVWNNESLYYYFKSIQDFDITLCDLPTGPFEELTKITLNHMDELWIMIDDNYHLLLSYQKYIEGVMKHYPHIKIHLIFNNAFPFSQQKLLEEKFGYSILTSLPPLDFEMVSKNNYESHPLIDKKKVKELYLPSYKKLYKHITDKDATIPFNKRIKNMFKKIIATH